MQDMWLRCLLFTQLLASRQSPGFEPHVGRMLWGSSLMAQMVKKLPAMRETQVPTLGQEYPLEEGMATDSSQYSRLENPMDRGTWRVTVHRVGHE